MTDLVAHAVPARWAVLLRGVNVGGHRRLPSADLKSAVEAAGGTDVATYLASGNATLTWPGDGPGLEQAVEAAVAEYAGITTDVLARRHDELVEALAADPFDDIADDAWVHVAFLRETPAVLASRDPLVAAPDRWAASGRHVFLGYATSPGRSKLAALALAGVAGPMTVRNRRTVKALADRTA